MLGQEDGRLPSRVPAPDDDHVGAAADPRLEVGGGVVDAGALEPLEVVDRESPVVGSGGHDHRLGGDLAAVAEADDVEAVLDPEAGGQTRRVEPGAQPHGLDGGPGHQIVARYAVGEAHVVLDP